MCEELKVDSVVWVDLGFSYGWWPAVVMDKGESDNSGEMSKGNPKMSRANPEMSKPNLEMSKANLEMSKANPEMSKANPELSKANLVKSKANPEMSKANPEMSKANPEMSNANPGMSKVNQEMSKANPEKSKTNPEISKANPECLRKQKSRWEEAVEWEQVISENDKENDDHLANLRAAEQSRKKKNKNLTIFDICPGFAAKKPEPKVTKSEIRKALKVDSLKSKLDSSFKVKFFDDEKGETYSISDRNHIKPYRCPDKVEMIRDGLKKFEILKLADGCLGGQTRQTQFVKDVEMAEVLTDMSPEVLEILGNFELDGVCEEREETNKKRKSRKRKRRN